METSKGPTARPMPSWRRWRATRPALVKSLGIDLQIYPAKGVTVTVPAASWPDGPQVPIIDDTRLFGLIRLGDRYRCSGSVEFDGWNTIPNPTRGKAIVDNVISVFPQFASCYDPASAKLWAGLRPMAASGSPYLGATPIKNLLPELRPRPSRMDACPAARRRSSPTSSPAGSRRSTSPASPSTPITEPRRRRDPPCPESPLRRTPDQEEIRDPGLHRAERRAVPRRSDALSHFARRPRRRFRHHQRLRRRHPERRKTPSTMRTACRCPPASGARR